MNDIIPIPNNALPVRQETRLSPIQQFAVDIFLRNGIHNNLVRPGQLLPYYGGLKTLSHPGLASAIETFVEMNDPHNRVPMYGGDIFNWELEGEAGFAGTISNIGEPKPLGESGLSVYNVAVLPFPSSTSQTWYDGRGNLAEAGYDPIEQLALTLDPLLLVSEDPVIHNNLLSLQEGICTTTLEVARPLVGINAQCYENQALLWEYSGPLNATGLTPPAFANLPGGMMYVSDGRGRIGEDYLSIRDPRNVFDASSKAYSKFKEIIRGHLTSKHSEDVFVPNGILGKILGTGDYQTVVTPSPLDQLLLGCTALRDNYLKMGIDELTASASAYSWYVGVVSAARNLGIEM